MVEAVARTIVDPVNSLVRKWPCGLVAMPVAWGLKPRIVLYSVGRLK